MTPRRKKRVSRAALAAASKAFSNGQVPILPALAVPRQHPDMVIGENIQIKQISQRCSRWRDGFRWRYVLGQGFRCRADRLLPLPPVLAGKGDADNDQIAIALGTTGFFIEKRLMRSLGDRPMPAARQRLIDAIGRQGA